MPQFYVVAVVVLASFALGIVFRSGALLADLVWLEAVPALTGLIRAAWRHTRPGRCEHCRWPSRPSAWERARPVRWAHTRCVVAAAERFSEREAATLREGGA